MRRQITVTTACIIAVSAACLVGSALAAATTKIQLRHTRLGTILVDSRGFTLYAFTRDSRNRDSCAAISGCASVWPLTKQSGALIAGTGVNRALLGSIKVGRSRQVTYAGRPLYGYTGDGGPGSTDYVGFNQFGGTWYALDAHGKVVK